MHLHLRIYLAHLLRRKESWEICTIEDEDCIDTDYFYGTLVELKRYVNKPPVHSIYWFYIQGLKIHEQLYFYNK